MQHFLSPPHYSSSTAENMKFSLKDLFTKCNETADLVTFTDEIFHTNFLFFTLCPLFPKLTLVAKAIIYNCYKFSATTYLEVEGFKNLDKE